MDHSEISLLFKKLVNNQCTKEQADLLLRLLTQKQYEAVFQQLIEEQLKQPEQPELDIVETQTTRHALNLKLIEILKADSIEIKAIKPKIRKFNFTRVAVIMY